MEVERFAEEAASEAIIPQSALEQQLRGMTVARDGWDVARVRALAARFRVTPLAMATRLRSAVDASRYLDLRFDHIEKLPSDLTTGAAGSTGVDDGD